MYFFLKYLFEMNADSRWRNEVWVWFGLGKFGQVGPFVGPKGADAEILKVIPD